MALTRCALAAALASFVVAAPLSAQAGTGIVTGRVIDSASQQPLVSVTIRDRSALGQAVRRLDEEGIAVDDLSLRRPSLDEVFLAITGHAAEEKDELGDADPGRADERRTA